jgi:hypothetical protein
MGWVDRRGHSKNQSAESKNVDKMNELYMELIKTNEKMIEM